MGHDVGDGVAAGAKVAPPRRFADMPELRAVTVALLKSQGFEVPTPVQQETIPLFCAHKDVAVDAVTGSGKTLAFVLPVVERLACLQEPLKKNQIGAIIVSPTRELAQQIVTVAQPFVATVEGLTMHLLIGGSDPLAEVSRLKAEGANVLIGTPGRIDDVLKRSGGALDLKHFEVLVLDEADQLLDQGFRQQLDSIIARLPKQRRTGLFSATQTEAVQALTRAGLRNPYRVRVRMMLPQGGPAADPDQQQRTPAGLQAFYCVAEPDEKLPQLVHFLSKHKEKKVIVYFLTCACVDFFSLVLRRLPLLKRLTFTALHGRMKQAQREVAMEAYRSQPAGVLLCTDVAARGLDIPDVHWIVQMDAPQVPESFLHRVGRTARMGRSGSALIYLHPHEVDNGYVTYMLNRHKVPLSELPLAADVPNNVLAFLRTEAETDREVMERGVHAFVSYVRAYKEHRLQLLLVLASLDAGRLANSLGLLRMPKMPDIKRAKLSTSAFVASSVDPDTVRFRDKARQKQREQVLKKRDAEAKANGGHTEARAAHGGPARGNPDAAAAAGTAAAQREREAAERLPASKRRKLQQRDELAELTSEYRLLTKLKRGKISQHAFDVATGLSSDDEAEDMAAGSADAERADNMAEMGATGQLRGSNGVGGSGAGRDIDGTARGDETAEEGGAGSRGGAEDGPGNGRGGGGTVAGCAGRAHHQQGALRDGARGAVPAKLKGKGGGGVGKGAGRKRHGQAVPLKGGAVQTYVANQQRRAKRQALKSKARGGGVGEGATGRP